MTISSWLSWPISRSHARRGQRPNPASRPKKARFSLEPLEGRALLASYTAASVSALIADITAANTAGGANTITLTAATTAPYVLTAANNTTSRRHGTAGDRRQRQPDHRRQRRHHRAKHGRGNGGIPAVRRGYRGLADACRA